MSNVNLCLWQIIRLSVKFTILFLQYLNPDDLICDLEEYGIISHLFVVLRTIIVENDESSCPRHSFQRGYAYLCWLNGNPNSIAKSRLKKQYKQQLNLSFEKTPEWSLESFSSINLCRICFWKHWVNHPNSIYQTTQKMLTLIICGVINQRKYRTPLTKMIGNINADNYE